MIPSGVLTTCIMSSTPSTCSDPPRIPLRLFTFLRLFTTFPRGHYDFLRFYDFSQRPLRLSTTFYDLLRLLLPFYDFPRGHACRAGSFRTLKHSPLTEGGHRPASPLRLSHYDFLLAFYDFPTIPGRDSLRLFYDHFTTHLLPFYDFSGIAGA